VALSNAAALRSGAITLTLEASTDVAFTTSETLVIGAAEYPSRYAVPLRLFADAKFFRVSIAGAGATDLFLIYQLGL
jgi:hypothetical protein